MAADTSKRLPLARCPACSRRGGGGVDVRQSYRLVVLAQRDGASPH